MNAEATAAIEAGEDQKDAGMDMAAQQKTWRIRRAQLALLRAIRRSPARTATTDDATSDISAQYPDGGRWRGSVPRQLAIAGLIEPCGVVKSTRTARHRGYLTLWRGVDDAAIDSCIYRLGKWLAFHPFPTTVDTSDNYLFSYMNEPDPAVTAAGPDGGLPCE